MFCEHEVLNPNNLCLLCFGRLSCSFKSLIRYREGGWSKKEKRGGGGGNNVKGKVLALESKLCPSLPPLCVAGILFSVLGVLTKHSGLRAHVSRPQPHEHTFAFLSWH